MEYINKNIMKVNRDTVYVIHKMAFLQLQSFFFFYKKCDSWEKERKSKAKLYLRRVLFSYCCSWKSLHVPRLISQVNEKFCRGSSGRCSYSPKLVRRWTTPLRIFFPVFRFLTFEFLFTISFIVACHISLAKE